MPTLWYISVFLIQLNRLILPLIQDALFTGVQRDDGTSVTLSSANKLTLAIALERILFFQKTTLGWLDGNAVVPHKSCKSRTTCTREKMVINYRVTWETKERLDLSFLLGGWDSSWSNRLCDVCESAAREYTDASVQKGWELLPTFFGLPQWEDLKDVE
jgi:hypothetical protein